MNQYTYKQFTAGGTPSSKSFALFALMDCGLIAFDPTRGYFLTERGQAATSNGR